MWTKDSTVRPKEAEKTNERNFNPDQLIFLVDTVGSIQVLTARDRDSIHGLGESFFSVVKYKLKDYGTQWKYVCINVI
jgi:hypothetical protein